MIKIDKRQSIIINSILLFQRGIFSGDEKACKRKDLLAEAAPIDELKRQSAAFSMVLDNDVSFVTLNEEAFDQFSGTAADSLYDYICKYKKIPFSFKFNVRLILAQSLSDPSCDATRRDLTDDSLLRALTDIFIFVDTQYQFTEIQPVVG